LLNIIDYPRKKEVDSLLFVVNRYDNVYKTGCPIHVLCMKKVFYLRLINSYTESALGTRLLIDET